MKKTERPIGGLNKIYVFCKKLSNTKETNASCMLACARFERESDGSEISGDDPRRSLSPAI